MSLEPALSAKFTTLFESHPDAVILHGGEGVILDCNVTAARMTGYSREELLSMPVDVLFGDELVHRVSSLTGDEAGDDRVSLDTLCCRKDGSEVPVRVDMAVFRDGGGTFTFLAFRDVTADNRAKEDREHLERQLEHARKLGVVGELTGDITHYYNNVFTGLIGTLGMVKSETTGELLALLKRAEKMANIASGFTRSLLAFSRDAEPTVEPADVGILIESVEEFARLTFDKRFRVTVEKEKELDHVLADSAALHHMLLNLVVNARDALVERERSQPWDTPLFIKLTAGNAVIDDVYTAEHPGSHRGRFVRVTVADTGCGMEETIRKRAFEPFFTTKPPGSGTGLGLASAHATVTGNGGWFEIESEPGRGTAVTFFLPAITMKRPTTLDDGDIDLPGGDETVLLIDDDEMIRSLGAMTLEGLGYRVLTAEDGGSGLDCFLRERNAVSLVLVDLVLPDIPGGEVLRRIRKVAPDTAAVITSGHDFEHDRNVFLELKADDYIIKPFTIADLALSVRSVLDRRRPDAGGTGS
ncbi:MAG: response regulator [Candidatus Latescibacteria bacterium]|nr:response regulator [Candidatus Latescibacterota bacterium]